MSFWHQWIEAVLWRTLDYIGRLGRWSIPVLIYHSINDQGGLCAITPSLLRQHFQYLAEHSYVGLKCSELMTSLGSQDETPAVVLTFDDGYANFADVVLPLLREFGFSATVFPVVNKIGGVSDWGRLKGVPIRGLMGWSELRAAAQQGIEIGSHGLEHQYLPECSEAELEREIKESKSRLEQGIGQEVSTFCYPYGAYNETVLRLVMEAGYRQACASRYDLCRMGTQPFEIPRISMDIFQYHGDRGMKIFPACLTGGSRLYISLRNLILKPPIRYDKPDGI
jgi:peptidoglycan/xylan/chitin deacetylase (PgdA/CDA1 family)